ncbi:nucleoplasmin-like protein ANO39 [Brassica napus]|uniref:nucleoplasmin-like protein ANO39 n=1 Tax=Brassica napus TaxID=3708 RepID=UPI00207938CF|nr:nucleoplasmin-like protein ANO39 [Brassica napus]
MLEEKEVSDKIIYGGQKNRDNLFEKWQRREEEDELVVLVGVDVIKAWRSSRIKSLAAQADEVEDVTSRHDEVEDVTPEDGGVVEEDKGNDNEAVQAEKTMSEGDKEDPEVEDDEEACLTGQEQKEDEEEAHNMVEDGVLNEKENKEEALNMEEDGVSNAQDDEIPYTEGVQLPGDEVKEKK